MSQSVFGRQHKLLRLMSGRLPTKPLPSAAKESTNDVPEVVSVKNLPENGASLSNLLHVQEGRMIFGPAESRVNSPSAQRQRHRAREKKPGRFIQFQQPQKVQIYRRDLLQQPRSSFCSSRASRWRSAPRPHAHVRAHTHTWLEESTSSVPTHRREENCI